ncbi:MAG: hypothetical protein U5K53_06240 [Halanaerobiales bacterium]|nr:hypothetical protein [Halanaerobiales bacterium]
MELFGRGLAWLDTGTHDGLLEAANFVELLNTSGLIIFCLEEIAYRNEWIDKETLLNQLKSV